MVALAATAICLALPPAAGASVRFGADMSTPASAPGVGCSAGQTCTFTNSTPPTAGPQITSPLTGTVVRFVVQMSSGSTAPTITFRVIHSASTTTYTGTGASDAVPTPTTAGIKSFPGHVPITAEDRLGIEISGGPSSSTTLFALDNEPGAHVIGFFPALADVARTPSQGPFSNVAMQLAADVAALPTSAATIPSCANGPVAATVTADPDPDVAPKALHFRIDGGGERTVPTDAGGGASMNVPDGTFGIEYWGEDSVGGVEPTHHTGSVTVDTAKPTVTISSEQGKVAYTVGEPASIGVIAGDVGGGLANDPSATRQAIPTAVPGTFTETRTATDKCGNTASASFTYTVTVDPLPAAVTGLAVRPKSFAAAATGASTARAKVGATISYTDSQPAKTTFTVQRPARGVRKGSRCVKPGKRKGGKRCTRYTSVGSFTHADASGKNSFGFTGRVKGRKLRPGSYRLSSVARGPNGKTGKSAAASFKIVSR
jgi:hypothetical protein